MNQLNNEAFLYCWYDTNTDKRYLGYHKGDIDDGYICSSKIFLKEYKERPQEFYRKILVIGGTADIRELERRILHEVNAARNPKFYNKHNGGKGFGGVPHTVESRMKLSKSHKGKPLSSAHYQSMCAAMARRRGVPRGPLTEIIKQKISESETGKFVSEESRKKLSASHTGYKMPQSQKDSISMAHKGVRKSDIHCMNVSKARKAGIIKRFKEGNPINFNASLVEHQVREIRELFKLIPRMTNKEIGERYGVPHNIIRSVRAGTTWKYLD